MTRSKLIGEHPDAEQNATDRYYGIDASTFLYSNDAQAFNTEVRQCVPFLKALLARIAGKEAGYRARNKRVDDLVIRSSAQYTNRLWSTCITGLFRLPLPLRSTPSMAPSTGMTRLEEVLQLADCDSGNRDSR